MHILTVDVEEWYHLLGVECLNDEDIQDRRMESNLDRLLKVLEAHGTRATFFVLGSVAEEYPDMVRKLAERYEVGSHGYRHRLLGDMGLKEFEKDVMHSMEVLERICGKRPVRYRAPGFSFPDEDYLRVLFDCGVETDCSLAAINHPYGRKMLKGDGPCLIEHGGRCIREMPPTTISLLGRRAGFLGGGYFRLFPYMLTRRWTEQNRDYSMTYIHPRDVDAGQPRIKGLPPLRRLRSYVGLKGAERKLRRYAGDFDFVDVATAEGMIDWDRVPVVRL